MKFYEALDIVSPESIDYRPDHWVERAARELDFVDVMGIEGPIAVESVDYFGNPDVGIVRGSDGSKWAVARRSEDMFSCFGGTIKTRVIPVETLALGKFYVMRRTYPTASSAR